MGSPGRMTGGRRDWGAGESSAQPGAFLGQHTETVAMRGCSWQCWQIILPVRHKIIDRKKARNEWTIVAGNPTDRVYFNVKCAYSVWTFFGNKRGHLILRVVWSRKAQRKCCPDQKSAPHLPPLVGSAVLGKLWGGPTSWHNAQGGQLVPRAHRRPVCWNITKRSLGLSTSDLREDTHLRKGHWRFRWFLFVPLAPAGSLWEGKRLMPQWELHCAG